jgi:uncharacterized membrane protein
MSGRSDVAGADRIFGALAYLIPIIEVAAYGLISNLFDTFPIFQTIYSFLSPITSIYSGTPFGSFAIFLLLYFLVISNPRVSRFVRFNVLQALMISILLSLCGLVIKYLLIPIPGLTQMILVLAKVIFLGTWALSIYGIVATGMGKYAEVPQLSENAHFMVDRM